jgi:hypothetical protein
MIRTRLVGAQITGSDGEYIPCGARWDSKTCFESQSSLKEPQLSVLGRAAARLGQFEACVKPNQVRGARLTAAHLETHPSFTSTTACKMAEFRLDTSS